jgi:hypothetical protein
MEPESRGWLWACAVTWVATRDRALADSLMNCDFRIFDHVVWAIEKTGADRSVAKKLAVDSIVALHTAGVEGRFLAHAVVEGRAITLAPAAWLKGTIRNRFGGVAIDGINDRAVTIGGVEPLLKPDDVIGVFPPAGGRPDAVQPTGPQPGRPPNDNSGYVELGCRLFKEGFTATRVQQIITQRLMDDGEARLRNTASRRAREKIMAEVNRVLEDK